MSEAVARSAEEPAPAWTAEGPFERRPAATASSVRYRRADGRQEVALEGEAPAAWPPRVDRLRVAAGSTATKACATLTTAGGELRVPLRRWHAHEPLPDLYAASLAGFAPTARERRIVRWLLRLLRIPGTPGLLRAWHARRSR